MAAIAAKRANTSVTGSLVSGGTPNILILSVRKFLNVGRSH